jgi:hypothetical protein
MNTQLFRFGTIDARFMEIVAEEISMYLKSVLHDFIVFQQERQDTIYARFVSILAVQNPHASS